MKLTDYIAQHMEEAYLGINWTEVNMVDTLSDVSVQEASRITSASPNTIASIIQHLHFYNNVMFKRLQGEATIIDEANGFKGDAPATENEWQQLQQDCIQSLYNLTAAVRRADESSLFEPILPGYSTTYKNLHGIAEHLHYHLGQVVLLKKLIRSANTNLASL